MYIGCIIIYTGIIILKCPREDYSNEIKCISSLNQIKDDSNDRMRHGA